MKKRMLCCLMALLLAGSARATSTYFYTVDTTVPDNDLKGYGSDSLGGLRI
jgi:hypothetical protein